MVTGVGFGWEEESAADGWVLGVKREGQGGHGRRGGCTGVGEGSRAAGERIGKAVDLAGDGQWEVREHKQGAVVGIAEAVRGREDGWGK